MKWLQSLKTVLKKSAPPATSAVATLHGSSGVLKTRKSEAAELIDIVREHSHFLYVESIVPTGLKELIENENVSHDQKLERMASHPDLPRILENAREQAEIDRQWQAVPVETRSLLMLRDFSEQRLTEVGQACFGTVHHVLSYIDDRPLEGIGGPQIPCTLRYTRSASAMSEKERIVYLFGELIEFCECGDADIWAKLLTAALHGNGAGKRECKVIQKYNGDDADALIKQALHAYKPISVDLAFDLVMEFMSKLPPETHDWYITAWIAQQRALLSNSW